jgi:transposase
MRQKSGAAKTPSEQIVRDIRRATRKHYSAEDKQELKEVVVEQALELRLLKKSTIADGGDGE